MMIIGKWKRRLALTLGLCLLSGQTGAASAIGANGSFPAASEMVANGSFPAVSEMVANGSFPAASAIGANGSFPAASETGANGESSPDASASGASPAPIVTAAVYGLYDEVLDREAEWIAGLQLGSGVVPMAPGNARAVPYFTNIAMLGLLEKPERAPVVRQYMDWYFAHLNRMETADAPAGSIYDYAIGADGTTETPTGDFDSTDSYASTFLNLLRKYAEATGDIAYLQTRRSDIELIAGAMLATKQADGMTWAKPAYRVKYLMDNSEVYKGLADMEWISSAAFGDEASAAVYRGHKDEVFTGISNGLWSGANDAYAYAKTEDGALLYPDWSRFYADAAAQLFPIWTGVLEPDSERALQLYNTFNAHHPGWPQLDKGDAFPWSILAYTAAVMGDRARVDQFLASVKSAYIDGGHPWPWYVMESGVAMLAAAEMKRQPDDPRFWTMGNLQDGDELNALPYTVAGTAGGVLDIEMRWTHGLTGRTQTFRATAANETWQMTAEGLPNGAYTVDITAQDRFGNVVAAQRISVSVKVAGDGPAIGRAAVLSDRSVLRRGESTSLKTVAYAEDGRTPVALNGAAIEYRTDRPDLAAVDAEGKLTLRALAADVDRITVWALITCGNDVILTEQAFIAVSPEAPTMADDALDRLAAWITGRQLDSGAIALNAAERDIVPAAASIGALGLLLREETVPSVKRYIDWYTANWTWGDGYGIYGTIGDYRKNSSSGQWEPTGAYDSASPNIGTFISLLRAYYEKTGEFKLTQTNLDLMTGGVGMLRSQADDGLMWKLPDEQTKRLLDNALSYKGMSDSIWLFTNRFQAAGPAGYFQSFADFLRSGIQSKLWNGEAGVYFAALNDRGEGRMPNLALKSEAAEQLAAVYAGIVPPDGDEARRLYDAYNRRFPRWADCDVLSGVDAAAAYTAALLGDRTRASAFLGRVLDALKTDRLPADWTVEQAGYAMLAAEKLRTLPVAAAVVIHKPEDGDDLKKGSFKVKGTVSGAKRIRIEWREKYGVGAGRQELDVRKKNGKWRLKLDGLRRGSAYEITVSALDERGYPLSGTARSVTVEIAALRHPS